MISHKIFIRSFIVTKIQMATRSSTKVKQKIVISLVGNDLRYFYLCYEKKKKKIFRIGLLKCIFTTDPQYELLNFVSV